MGVVCMWSGSMWHVVCPCINRLHMHNTIHRPVELIKGNVFICTMCLSTTKSFKNYFLHDHSEWGCGGSTFKYYICTSLWNITHIWRLLDTFLTKYYVGMTDGCVHTMCTCVCVYMIMECLSVCPRKFISLYRTSRLAHTNTTHAHLSETWYTYGGCWTPFSQKIMLAWRMGVYTRCIHVCMSTR